MSVANGSQNALKKPFPFLPLQTDINLKKENCRVRAQRNLLGSFEYCIYSDTFFMLCVLRRLHLSSFPASVEAPRITFDVTQVVRSSLQLGKTLNVTCQNNYEEAFRGPCFWPTSGLPHSSGFSSTDQGRKGKGCEIKVS